MRQSQSASKSKKQIKYPDETNGSRLGAKARKLASRHSAEERRAHINEAMVLVYGGADDKKSPLARR